uniref:Uncharacterized protein n=1 Tax=Chromera velia CCMP2878 TaxID=1169474 RepID=A0A0G4HZ57_9ALVE|eukprot:Cvel_33841.t1-p1 / transcript=Cvel_33841.t1 / gene=Cvel_33841 / organism=Chromera_velia_CCMP2878 / gene_product=hypothetical protein / transcript_product=hypothetical protein / location=Cvel_scaffold5620:828-1778(-) / protein_length=249 / sequence_SO=supercontig / SO=protein_coding / is_pseudo=false
MIPEVHALCQHLKATGKPLSTRWDGKLTVGGYDPVRDTWTLTECTAPFRVKEWIEEQIGAKKKGKRFTRWQTATASSAHPPPEGSDETYATNPDQKGAHDPESTDETPTAIPDAEAFPEPDPTSLSFDLDLEGHFAQTSNCHPIFLRQESSDPVSNPIDEFMTAVDAEFMTAEFSGKIGAHAEKVEAACAEREDRLLSDTREDLQGLRRATGLANPIAASNRLPDDPPTLHSDPEPNPLCSNLKTKKKR